MSKSSLLKVTEFVSVALIATGAYQIMISHGMSVLHASLVILVLPMMLGYRKNNKRA